MTSVNKGDNKITRLKMAASGHIEVHKRKHVHLPLRKHQDVAFLQVLANRTTSTDFGFRNKWNQTLIYDQFYALKTFLVPIKPQFPQQQNRNHSIYLTKTKLYYLTISHYSSGQILRFQSLSPSLPTKVCRCLHLCSGSLRLARYDYLTISN